MGAVEVKRFDSPDETRPFEGKGEAKVVHLAGHTVGKGTFEPGWKWSENVKPIAGTDSCQVAHFAYVLSGRCGSTWTTAPRWRPRPVTSSRSRPATTPVPGPEACVMVDFGEIGDYAKRS